MAVSFDWARRVFAAGIVLSAGLTPTAGKADAAHTPVPEIRVTLSKPIYWITHSPRLGTPQMPTDVSATAQIVNWPINAPKPAAFTWRVALDWNFKPYPTHHSLSKRTFVQSSPLAVHFGQEIRGGTLTVMARARLGTQEIVGKATALVRGTNPTHEAILRAFPKNRFGLIASKIGIWESGLHHFTRPTPADPGGLPYVSYTNDVGLMQLNAFGSLTAPDQVWDWRANLRHGLAMFASKLRVSYQAAKDAAELQRRQQACNETVRDLNALRKAHNLPPVLPPVVEPISDLVGSGVLPNDADPDHLALSQWERDAIRRYNGGREYRYVIHTDLRGMRLRSFGWQVDPSRGGVRRAAGDPDYVRNVLRSRSGLLLLLPKAARFCDMDMNALP